MDAIDRKIVYVDMDDTMCDYKLAMREALLRHPEQKYPQAQIDFFRKLHPIEGAIESMNELKEFYDIYILTRPSVQNALCYTEKRLWVEDHMGIEWCHKLIICPNKALMIGDYLVDDVRWSGFGGTQIMFDKDGSNNWAFVRNYLLDIVK
jgi:5'-nucleotidase